MCTACLLCLKDYVAYKQQSQMLLVASNTAVLVRCTCMETVNIRITQCQPPGILCGRTCTHRLNSFYSEPPVRRRSTATTELNNARGCRRQPGIVAPSSAAKRRILHSLPIATRLSARRVVKASEQLRPVSITAVCPKNSGGYEIPLEAFVRLYSPNFFTSSQFCPTFLTLKCMSLLNGLCTQGYICQKCSKVILHRFE